MKKRILAILAMLMAIGAGIIGMQTQKQVTLSWDAMPTGETWTQVRLYDIAPTPEVLLGTANCAAGPPIVCPTTLSITVQKKAYQIVARSWNGDWESGNSNVVVLAGPPSAPTNLKK